VNSDIDECAFNNGGCAVNANCTNTDGNFTCTCHPGYIGDGLDCTGKLNICIYDKYGLNRCLLWHC